MALPEVLQSLVSGGAAGAVVGWLVQHLIAERLHASIHHEFATKLESHKADVLGLWAERERLARERWNLKREACLAALSLVDRVWAHFPWLASTTVGESKPTPSPVDPAEARDIMNRLILTCDDPVVVSRFLTCIALQESGDAASFVDPSEIQHLRNAIRVELGFGRTLQLNANLCWIVSVHGDSPRVANGGSSTGSKGDPVTNDSDSGESR